ncbi:hypothetical protein HX049_15595 [Myroides odoratimimus]|uniref:hypothetical protein n=1 Tax=Myroides odoratimimus TaxID=76832 RepID=UPI00257749FD|nr:hypothetical protein [Myroides odoratimimus]MDM1398572.1 hypothetical protein [Myroides odoratimimus]
MKIQILSDLHLEFGYSGSLKFDEVDLVILAGDTHIGNTQIICNPHGYIDDKDNGFERELIIEI